MRSSKLAYRLEAQGPSTVWATSLARHARVVFCPVDADHCPRAGRRIGGLAVELPERPLRDFTWTWMSDCLITPEVEALFRGAGISGVRTRSVSVRDVDDRIVAGPIMRELVAEGWGGVAPASSGIRLDPPRGCPGCGYLEYTPLTDPRRLFDPCQWDQSEVFMIWPLPRFIFVTERVAHLIREHELTGSVLTPLEDLAIGRDGFTPGRLSYYMSKGRARTLGGALGIA